MASALMMKRLYKRNKADNDTKNIQLNEDSVIDEVTLHEKPDANTIEEFMEIKKLQNKVLGKMLENMNLSENQEK